MEKQTILQRVKQLIASIGWKMFIFGNETTDERYWTEIYYQEDSRRSKPSKNK